MGVFICQVDAASDYTKSLEKEEYSWRCDRTKRIQFYVLSLAYDAINPESDDSVLGTQGIPALRSIYNGMYCTRVGLSEAGTVFYNGEMRISYTVTAEFSNSLDREEEDPTQWLPQVDYDSEEYEEVCTRDAIDTTKAIVNAVGDPIPATTKKINPVLIVTRYEAWPFAMGTKLAYEGKVNAATFFGAAPKTVLCSSIKVSKEYIEVQGTTNAYARVTYTFKYSTRPEGWKVSLLNQGPRCKDDSGEIVAATDSNGNVCGSVNLAADGTILGDDATPVFLAFDVFQTANFGDLNITI